MYFSCESHPAFIPMLKSHFILDTAQDSFFRTVSLVLDPLSCVIHISLISFAVALTSFTMTLFPVTRHMIFARIPLHSGIKITTTLHILPFFATIVPKSLHRDDSALVLAILHNTTITFDSSSQNQFDLITRNRFAFAITSILFVSIYQP